MKKISTVLLTIFIMCFMIIPTSCSAENHETPAVEESQEAPIAEAQAIISEPEVQIPADAKVIQATGKDDMKIIKQALSMNASFLAIVTNIIMWGGLITIIWILRGFVMTAITSAAISMFSQGDTDFNRVVVRRLTKKNMSPEKLYEELKTHFKDYSK